MSAETEEQKPSTEVNLETWFDEPEVKTETEEKEEVVEEKEEIVEDETQEEEEENDYEKPLPKKKKEKEEEDVEKLPPSKAVERAKIEGKARKLAEARAAELELERDRVVTEKEELASKLKEFETTRVKPQDHPDFKSKVDEIRQDTEDFMDVSGAPHADVIGAKLGDFIADFRSAVKDKKISEFKDTLTKTLFGDEDMAFDSLDSGDKKMVNEAFLHLKKTTAKADKLKELEIDLENKAKSGLLSVGVREYENAVKVYDKILASIGDFSEEFIENNPGSVGAIIAQLPQSPEGKRRLEAAKKDGVEFLHGLKPLTQTEIDKIEANGVSVKEYQAKRVKAFEDKRAKLLPIVIQAFAGWSTINERLAEAATIKDQKDSEESEDDAITKIRKNKVSSKDEPKKVTTESALDKWFES